MASEPPLHSAVLLDANVLVWTHHRQFRQHDHARQWLTSTLTATPVVGIPWPSVLAFLRISTHPRALERPLDLRVAWSVVDGWLARPNVRTPAPTDAHASLLAEMLIAGRAAANHTTDAHLAALAVEWGLVLVSADRDFARYPGLRWHDPSSDW